MTRIAKCGQRAVGSRMHRHLRGLIRLLAVAWLATGLVGVDASALDTARWVDVSGDPDTVWKELGDFCAIETWHPMIKACRSAEVDGKLTRTLTLADGATQVERLVDWNDRARTYTYRLVEGGASVVDLQATLAVRRHDGGSRIVWSGSYAPAAGVTAGKAWGAVRAFYDAGLKALAERHKT